MLLSETTTVIYLFECVRWCCCCFCSAVELIISSSPCFFLFLSRSARIVSFFSILFWLTIARWQFWVMAWVFFLFLLWVRHYQQLWNISLVSLCILLKRKLIILNVNELLSQSLIRIAWQRTNFCCCCCWNFWWMAKNCWCKNSRHKRKSITFLTSAKISQLTNRSMYCVIINVIQQMDRQMLEKMLKIHAIS